MSFEYDASVDSRTNELSSDISISFVKGDDKNAIVEHRINSEGELTNEGINISVGEVFKQKESNTYETYQPYLFSSEKISLNVLREVMEKSVEAFKKDANVEKAYCTSITIETEYDKEPKIRARVTKYEFASTNMRMYDYTTDGKFIR